MLSKENFVKNADEVATLVLYQAMLAKAQGTFAVGGCIIENSTGKIIHSMHNNVLKPLNDSKENKEVFTYDPTAHGERQLVYWYYENREKLKLPEPKDLTIVTTLDPCVMCTGTLLTAGFNVAVVAIDDFAGINYDETFSFNTLPPKLRDLAKSKFGYYACGKDEDVSKIYKRDYVGNSNLIFKNSSVNSQKLLGCSDIFGASVDKVRKNSSNSGLEPKDLKNPITLSEDSPIKVKFRKIFSDAFKITIPNFRVPNKKLHDLLIKAKETNNAKNSVALLDQFGNVILCLADNFDKSPVHTAFMNVTRKYAIERFELMNNEETKSETEEYLTHPKYGTFIFLYAPNPNDSTTIMGLGAYGSTMEGSIPQIFPSNFQYFYPPQEGTIEELNSVIMNLPPFYTTSVQISAMQTPTNF